MAKFLSKRSSGGGNIRDGGGHRGRRNLRPDLRKHGSDATELTRKATTMPDDKEINELQAVRDLLREGRATEADKQLNEIQEKLRQEAERIKRETPPPGPRTLAQLEHDFKATVTDLLGNNPRLSALIVEIKGQA